MSAAVVVVIAGLGFAAYKMTAEKFEKGAGKIYNDGKHAAKTMYKDGKQGAKNFADFARDIATRFNRGIHEESRTEGLTKVDGKLGLELATSEVVENFRDSDKKYTAWFVYLGETSYEINVPATFRYHLDPVGKWEIRVKDQACFVIAPPIQPSLPVAIDTARIEKRGSNGWARFDKPDKLDELERKITPELAVRAGDRAHIDQVRDQARRSVAQFVRTWLLHEDMWRSDAFTSVVVVFADEVSQTEQRPPTVTLEP